MNSLISKMAMRIKASRPGRLASGLKWGLRRGGEAQFHLEEMAEAWKNELRLG